MTIRVIFAACLSFAAFDAEAMRCGNKLVSAGQHMAEVLGRCGEPVHVQQRLIYRTGLPRPDYARSPGLRYRGDDVTREELLIHQRSVVEVQVELWTYNFGPRKLMRLVRFENGVVRDIKTLGYGFRE